MWGTAWMYGMLSRNTCELAGGTLGSRKASDSATERSDGTVRPVAVAISWPCVPSANSRNSHAWSLCSPAAVMQYASECSTVAGCLCTGS